MGMDLGVARFCTWVVEEFEMQKACPTNFLKANICMFKENPIDYIQIILFKLLQRQV